MVFGLESPYLGFLDSDFCIGLLGCLDGRGNQRAFYIRRSHDPQGITINPSALGRILRSTGGKSLLLPPREGPSLLN